MTRDEITKLLEFLTTNYNKKITDPKGLADFWEMALGSFSADAVFKAARLHMETSPFFPTPADIRKNIVRATVAYAEEQKSPARLTSIAGAEPIEDEKVVEWLDAFCEWIGFGYEEPNDNALYDYYQKNPDMKKKMEGVLPYEL